MRRTGDSNTLDWGRYMPLLFTIDGRAQWAKPCHPPDRRATAVVRATRRNRQGTRNSNGKRGGPVSASHAGKVYCRRLVSTRLAATLLADGAPCFAICACPALVIKRDCSYISIHFSLEIAEIRLPIASSGKSSDDSK